MNKNHLGIIAMIQSESIDGIAPEWYGTQKAKATDIQALNTRLFYDLIRQKRIPATSIFSDLVSNDDLVVHIIAYLSLKIVNISKELILCTFTTLQKMTHSVRTPSGDSKSTYGGDT